MSDDQFAQIGRLLAHAAADIIREEQHDHVLAADPINHNGWGEPIPPPSQRDIAVLSPIAPDPSIYVVLHIRSETITIRSRNDFATTPISGRASIFQKQAAEQRDITRAEIIGVFSSQPLAQTVRDNYAASQGDTGEEIIISGPHYLDPTPAGNPTPTEVPCIDCSTLVSDGTGLCEPCRQKRYRIAAQRDADIINETVEKVGA